MSHHIIVSNSGKATFGQIFYILILFIILPWSVLKGLSIFELYKHPQKISDPKNFTIEKLNVYSCLTTHDGNVPKKVVIRNPNNTECFEKPDTNSKVVKTLYFLDFYFLFNQDKDSKWIAVGSDSLKNTIDGWVKVNDVIFWNSRQAFRPKYNPGRKPIKAWKKLKDVGNNNIQPYIEKIEYTRFITQKRPFLLLSSQIENNIKYFQIVFDFGTDIDPNKFGATVGWTRLDNIPVEFVYYITKDHLQKHIEGLNEIIHNLANEGLGDHPIVKLFANNLSTTFGSGLQLENHGFSFMQQIAKYLPQMPDAFRKLPSEIKRDIEIYKNQLLAMKSFLENSSNWNKRDGAWIPQEILLSN